MLKLTKYTQTRSWFSPMEIPIPELTKWYSTKFCLKCYGNKPVLRTERRSSWTTRKVLVPKIFSPFYSLPFIFSPVILFFHSVHSPSLYSSFMPRFRIAYKSQCCHVIVGILEGGRIQRVSTPLQFYYPACHCRRRNHTHAWTEKPLCKFLVCPSSSPAG